MARRIVTISLPPSILRRVDQQARAQDRSRSQVIARTLSDTFKGDPMADTPRSSIEGTPVRSPFTSTGNPKDIYSPPVRMPTDMTPSNSKDGTLVDSPFNGGPRK
jgi:hypothetical protein